MPSGRGINRDKRVTKKEESIKDAFRYFILKAPVYPQFFHIIMCLPICIFPQESYVHDVVQNS